MPIGFPLKDPESLRAEDIADLWRHILHRQQDGQLVGFTFKQDFYDMMEGRSSKQIKSNNPSKVTQSRSAI
jgi:hypothetical protein